MTARCGRTRCRYLHELLHGNAVLLVFGLPAWAVELTWCIQSHPKLVSCYVSYVHGVNARLHRVAVVLIM
jgi:hypothetical protein